MVEVHGLLKGKKTLTFVLCEWLFFLQGAAHLKMRLRTDGECKALVC